MNQQYIKLEDSIRYGWSVTVEALVRSIRITTTSSLRCEVDTHISYDDARKLVEMLVKHTHPGQTLVPSKPQKELLILAYGADPTSAQGSRFLHVSNIAYATKLAEQLVNEKPNRPVWLAQLTKQFVQPTPSYEWKDL